MPDTPTIRLAHFSDIHLSSPDCIWRAEDWVNKRLFSWMNMRLLGRGYRFRHAERIMVAMLEDIRQANVDHVIFSGDATAMGFKEEMARAAVLCGLSDPTLLPGLAVPGNHDYCTRSAARLRNFENHFGAWQEGVRVGPETYPFAQRVGPIWLVGVNSASGNRWPWDARGGVGAEQRRRLDQLLQKLEGGPRILVTHYPVRVASGKREPMVRAMRDVDAVCDIAWRGGVSLWLHGHRHKAFHHLPSNSVPFGLVCTGSATQARRWSYGLYTLTGSHFTGQRRVFDVANGGFRDGVFFEMDLPIPDIAGIKK